MTATYENIATTTLTSTATEVIFNSIPSTFTDLVAICNVQASLTGQGVYLQMNGDSTNNYSCTILRGNGTAASSARITNSPNSIISNFSEPSTTTPSPYIVNFMNYANNTTNKTVISRGNNAAFGIDTHVTLYQSTSAISSIRFYISGGNMSIGSTFTLYGIKAE